MAEAARFWLFEVFAGALAGFYALVPSLGLAIIMLTLAVRILLLPLSIKQTRSMREMARIQPEVKKLQAKHKGDRQKMNEEMMALYKEHGVNPFGGCAPLLAQMPVLIGLFYVIREPLKYLGWTKPADLADQVIHPSRYIAQQASGIMQTLQDSNLADAIRSIPLEVNSFAGLRLDCHSAAALGRDDPSRLGEICGSGFISALPYLILVLLMGLSTWYQQKQMQASQDPKNPQAAQMQMLGRIMPIMLMVFAFNFPSGVVLYWLTTNLWTIVQQRIILAAVPMPGSTPQGKAAPTQAGSTPAIEGASQEGGADAPKPSGAPNPNRSKKKKKKKR